MRIKMDNLQYFDVETLKQRIKDTQPDEMCILIGGFSHYYYMDNEMFETLSNELGEYVYINDYNDLICDPNGIDQH